MVKKKYLSSDEVYEDLSEKIEKLVYMPGDSISENDLCKIYGVSRHIIRNAIIRLKERRLLTVYPQRGTFVSLIDMGYVEDILYLRESVEQESLARIMEMDQEKRDELVSKLESNLQMQKKNLQKELSMEEFYKVDNEFHQFLLSSVGKAQVMDIIKEPYIHVRRWRNFEVKKTHRLASLFKEHELLKEAIKKADKEKGRKVIHEHLDTVTRLQDIFKNANAEYFIFRDNTKL